MVEVEQGALRAFEEHMLAPLECTLDEPRGVVEVVAQPLTPAERLIDEPVDLERGLRPSNPG